MSSLSVTSYTTTCPIISTSTCSEGTVTTYTTTSTSVVYETHTKTYTLEQTTQSVPTAGLSETYSSLERHKSKSVLISPSQESVGPTQSPQTYGPSGGSGSEEVKPNSASAPGSSTYGGQGGEYQSSGSESTALEIITTRTSTRFLVQTIFAAHITHETSVSASAQMPSGSPAIYGSETKVGPSSTPTPGLHGSGQGESAPGRMVEESSVESPGPAPSEMPYYPVSGSNGTESLPGMIPTGTQGASGVLGTGIPTQSSPALYANGATISQKGVSGTVLAGVAGIAALCAL